MIIIANKSFLIPQVGSMDFSKLNAPSMRRLAHGVFQGTMPIDVTEMEISDFRFEDVELPVALKGAVKKRQIEFLCGRLCVKRALESLGFLKPIPPVPMDQDRIPIWPSGLMGSISHTDRLATAVVGRRSNVIWLGIDVERRMREVTEPFIQQVCSEADELTDLAVAHPSSREEALTVIFSAKESVYKAMAPMDQRRLGFKDLRIRSLGPQKVQAMLLKDLGSSLRKAMTWDVEVRRLDDDVVETLVLKGWDVEV